MREDLMESQVYSPEFETAIAEVLGEEAGYVNNPACSVDGCNGKRLSKGLCNAHYIRQRKGRVLSPPVAPRLRDRLCSACNKPTGAKGGLGLCAKHYKQRIRTANKRAAIAAMGGKCADCGGVFAPAAFDFHHLHGKDADPSRLLGEASPEKIADELSKCVLLCANCHRVRHYG